MAARAAKARGGGEGGGGEGGGEGGGGEGADSRMPRIRRSVGARAPLSRTTVNRATPSTEAEHCSHSRT